jgi:hypothetical protein
MTIYFDSTARKVRDFPVSEAERAARLVEAKDLGSRD